MKNLQFNKTYGPHITTELRRRKQNVLQQIYLYVKRKNEFNYKRETRN